ncbi:hypothetical protein BEP19_13915 [Ammoniphilus oxalaticus]|uniref:Nudix hydrolase domain-containing protein n=1 Tax=Ammoniphilus oxalaticus TaxID=66863 RepID=A0A419SEH7_9BACL|nr:NUDIX domain-containing protein [Ammoniphilus oxalaticus]RKD21722.1 hypothetical protein BEP19_13915 [Ammoniphilus oxalaticus]
MAEKIVQENPDQHIYLTFSPDLFSERPDHVLVIPIYEGKLLFTCHSERGWELPGGKIEPGETASQATIRETWEETGATILAPKQIGEYRVESNEQVGFIKAIYLAKVVSIGPRPKGFETDDAALFGLDINTNQPQFSPYMKDIVFASIQKKLGTEIQLPT